MGDNQLTLPPPPTQWLGGHREVMMDLIGFHYLVDDESAWVMLRGGDTKGFISLKMGSVVYNTLYPGYVHL